MNAETSDWYFIPVCCWVFLLPYWFYFIYYIFYNIVLISVCCLYYLLTGLNELMESKGGKKKSSSSSNSSLFYEAPLGYSIEDIRPNGGIKKFRSAAYSNVSVLSSEQRYCIMILSVSSIWLLIDLYINTYFLLLFQFFAVRSQAILIYRPDSLSRACKHFSISFFCFPLVFFTALLQTTSFQILSLPL